MKAILNNIFSFNKLISEEIIKLLYYVGLLAIALGFIYNIWQSFTSGVAAFLPLLIGAIITVLVSVLAWRVICELIVVLFRMYKRLGAINAALGGEADDDSIPGDEALKAAREAAMKARERVSASVKDVAEDTKEAASKAGAAVKERTSKAASTAKAKAADLKPGSGEIEVIPPAKPAAKPAVKKTAAKTTRKPAVKKTTAKKSAPKKTAAKKTAPKKPATKRAAPKKAAPKKPPAKK